MRGRGGDVQALRRRPFPRHDDIHFVAAPQAVVGYGERVFASGGKYTRATSASLFTTYR